MLQKPCVSLSEPLENSGRERLGTLGGGGHSQLCRGRNVENPSLRGALLLLSRARMAGVRWQRASGPESQAGRSFALLLPLAGLFVPLAKGTQVVPVLLVSFSNSPALRPARGEEEAPRPVTRSVPPTKAGEAGRGLSRSRPDRTSPGAEDGMSFFPAEITTLGNWDCREEVRVHCGWVLGVLWVWNAGTCSHSPKCLPSRPFSRVGLFGRWPRPWLEQEQATWHFCERR